MLSSELLGIAYLIDAVDIEEWDSSIGRVGLIDDLDCAGVFGTASNDEVLRLKGAAAPRFREGERGGIRRGLWVGTQSGGPPMTGCPGDRDGEDRSLGAPFCGLDILKYLSVEGASVWIQLSANDSQIS